VCGSNRCWSHRSSSDGHLRHSKFVGLRGDKAAGGVFVKSCNDGFTTSGGFLVELNIEPGALRVRSEKMGVERLGIAGRRWTQLDVQHGLLFEQGNLSLL
jgi:hypothetical protein